MNSLSFGMKHDANISVMFDLVSKSISHDYSITHEPTLQCKIHPTIYLFFDDMCFLLGLFPFLHRIVVSENFSNIFSPNYFSFQN